VNKSEFCAQVAVFGYLLTITSTPSWSPRIRAAWALVQGRRAPGQLGDLPAYHRSGTAGRPLPTTFRPPSHHHLLAPAACAHARVAAGSYLLATSSSELAGSAQQNSAGWHWLQLPGKRISAARRLGDKPVRQTHISGKPSSGRRLASSARARARERERQRERERKCESSNYPGFPSLIQAYCTYIPKDQVATNLSEEHMNITYTLPHHSLNFIDFE
jgi:hypothetical protein